MTSTIEEQVKLINELRQIYPLKVLLLIANIARSTFYYTLSKVDKDKHNFILMEQIRIIFHQHKGCYGYRRITLALQQQGNPINHKKVKRLMKKMNLFGCMPKAKYKSYNGKFHHMCPTLYYSRF